MGDMPSSIRVPVTINSTRDQWQTSQLTTMAFCYSVQAILHACFRFYGWSQWLHAGETLSFPSSLTKPVSTSMSGGHQDTESFPITSDIANRATFLLLSWENIVNNTSSPLLYGSWRYMQQNIHVAQRTPLMTNKMLVHCSIVCMTDWTWRHYETTSLRVLSLCGTRQGMPMKLSSEWCWCENGLAHCHA